MTGAILRRLHESLRAFGAVFENRSLRRIQLAWAGSMIGAWSYGIAVAVFAYTEDGAYAVGAVALVRTVAAGAAAPLTGVLGDRYPRVRVMVLSDLVRAAVMLVMAVVVFADGPALVVYALSVVATLASTAFRPAQAALLPTIARSPDELTASNVTSSTIESVGIFVGPALGGLLLAATNVGVVFVTTAVLFVWSAVLLVGIREGARGETVSEEEPAGILHESLAGFRTLAVERDVRLLVGLFAAQTFVDGALSVLIVVLALETLDLGASGVGFLNSASGVGGVVGALLAAVLLARGRLATDFGLGIVLWGLPLMVVGLWTSEVTALVLLAVVGVGNTIVDVAGDTLMQRAIPDEVLARVFGVLESLTFVTVGLGSIAAPLLVTVVGARGALIATGALLPVLALLSWRRLAAIDRNAAAPARELELLRSLPMFAPLPPPTLEYLASRLVARRVPAGEVVFRRGDVGDDFYVIGEGRVEVAVDGSRPVELGPGEAFGEIALLRQVPRTATVSAKTDVELYALERQPFIAAVAAHADSARAAEAVVAARLGAPRLATL